MAPVLSHRVVSNRRFYYSQRTNTMQWYFFGCMFRILAYEQYSIRMVAFLDIFNHQILLIVYVYMECDKVHFTPYYAKFDFIFLYMMSSLII